MSGPGRLVGVGTGPGDPELLTLKAVRAIESADVVAHFAKLGNGSNARTIIAAHLKTDQIEEPLLYPVTSEIEKSEAAYQSAITGFYDASAKRLAGHLDAGLTVAVLSEGDPLFYGSYMHLHVRLAHLYPTQVIPGVTAMSGCWSAAGMPIVQGDDVMSIVPGTLPETELSRRIAGSEAVVIMKVGRHLAKIRRALEAAGRLADAVYVERGTMAAGVVQRLAEKADDVAPYFALVLVPGWRGRP